MAVKFRDLQITKITNTNKDSMFLISFNIKYMSLK